MSVKARGNFMEVEEPKYAKTILGCDLNKDHKMIAVNGSTTDISPIGSDYNITINAYKVSGGYDGSLIRSIDSHLTATAVIASTYFIGIDRNLGTYMTCEGDNWKKTVFTSNGDVLRRSAGREP